jgi:NHLM bacteriocin system ABC transporter ATP-binding protein
VTETRPGSLTQALEPFAETVLTAANRPLPLDDVGAVWHVVSSPVDVFYVQPEPGQPQGSRRHLCRIEEGGSIFAIDGVRGLRDGSLLAVGVSLARLLKFPNAELVRLSLDSAWRPDVARMIDDWVDQISRAVESGEPPRTAVSLEADRATFLNSGQSVVARSQVLWVRQAEEGLCFRGQIVIPVCPLGSRFPLSPHAWLTFGQREEVIAWTTERLMENGDVWVGLRRFHRIILDAIALARGQERAVRHARLESSVLRDEELTARAVTAMAKLASPHTSHMAAQLRGPVLLESCRAVGSAMGLEIKAPPFDAEGDALRLIAQASGFRTRRVRLGAEWWTADGGPMLGFLAVDNRPVALVPTSQPSYALVDATRGTRIAVTAAIARSLSPTAVIFSRTLPPECRTGAGLLRFSVPAIRGELRTILALGLLSGLLGLAGPSLAAIVIDEMIPRADRGQLGLLCMFLVSLGVAMASFQAIQGLALVRIKGRLESILLPAVWDRLFNLPTRFFSNRESGDLALRAVGIARLIELLASTSAASLLVGSFSLLNVIVLFYLNWRLALVAVALLAIALLASAAMLPSLARCMRSIARAQGEISSLLLGLLGGIARLRVAGAEQRAFVRWAEKYKHQLERMIQFQKTYDQLLIFGDMWPLVTMMIMFAAVIGLGPAAITVGDFLAFNMALAQGWTAVSGLSKSWLPLLSGLEQFERFRPILECTPEGTDIRGEAVVLGGAIRLTNVSFRYDPDGPLVLDAVNLQIRLGEFVAVVGPSGSGKSTLLRLLLGFETPTEGVIAYDGRELFTLDIQELRRQIGVVLQDAQLFPGDIASNIIGQASHLREADAWQAAALAGLADDISNMPMGIHTVIGEGGGGLSSGQRQRLIIARALVNRPKILLLDEATSALDNRTQAVVGQSLHFELQGTSRLAIAHRVSTIVDADRIYVLCAGKIVQSGRYSQLIQEQGPFRDLAQRQSLA